METRETQTRARRSATAWWRLARGAAGLAGALLLAGCWGDGDGVKDIASQQSPVPEESSVVAKSPRTGHARLGVLKDASVEVFNLHSEIPFHRTTTDGQGRFDIDLGSQPLDALYLVRVRGGTDLNFDDAGTPGQAPVPNSSTLTAVATGRQIAEHGVSVTVLSDALARRVGDALTWNPVPLVMRELNDAATRLVARDINGDNTVDYLDVLAFNPEDAAHKAKLAITYADFFVKNSQGQSVMDLYHANSSALPGALSALLSGVLNIRLPDADQAVLAALNFGVEGHGSLQAAVLPAPVTHASGRWLHTTDKSTTSRISLRATPDAGSRLLGWEGCDVDPSDPALCHATPDLSKTVLAIFQDPAVPKPDTTALRLASETSAVGFVLRDGQAVVTVRADDPLATQLDAALGRIAADPSHRLFVGGDLAKQATVRVLSAVDRRLVNGVVRHVLNYADAVVTDALASGSAYAPPAAITVDSIALLRYGAPGASTTPVAPKNEANADAMPGPNPVNPAVDQQLCGDTKRQHLLVSGAVVCLAPENLPVQSALGQTRSCRLGQTLVELLDGEQFCVSPADIHDASEVQAASAAAPSRTLSFAPVQGTSMTVQSLQQPVQIATGQPVLAAGDVVWLVGHGRAIYMAHNVFMIDRADGKGIRMVTVKGAVGTVADGSKAPMAFQQCARHAAAPECQFFGRSQALQVQKVAQAIAAPGKTAQVNLLPPITFAISPLRFPWITFEFTANVDLTGTASANFDWGVLWYAFGSRGSIEVTPYFNASVTADGLGLFKAPAAGAPSTDRELAGTSQRLASGEPIFEQNLFTVDFLQKIPYANLLSPVLESQMRLAIGVDATGTARIEIETSYKQVVAWDVRSEFTYYVFQSNHNHQSFKVGAKGFPGASLRGEFNASIGLYAKAAVSMGPRGIIPQLATLEAKYYPLKMEALGKVLLSYQTDPVKVAAQHGQNFCWAGAVSMAVKETFDVNARIDFRPSDGTLRDILSYIGLPSWEWNLFNWEHIKWSVGARRGDFAPAEAADADADVTGLGQAVDTSNILTADTVLTCPAPTPANQPTERNYLAGNFKLENGRSIYTRTHEFTMQPDGMFAIYAWNGQRGARVWGTTSTQGQGLYNAIRFQSDGHLVIHDMLDTFRWGSNTYEIGASRLRFSPSGAMEIWAKNAMVWSTAVGPMRNIPAQVQFKPGELTLRNDEAVVSASRSLWLQPSGALGFFRTADAHRAGSAAWWNAVLAGPNSRLDFQTDGNLVVRNAAGTVVWSSNTANRGATRLILEPGGRLTIYNDNNATYLFAVGP